MYEFNVNPYQLEFKTVLEKLGSSTKGLSDQEAKKRLEKYGLNKIAITKKSHPAIIFLRQFKSALIWLLIFAAIVSFLLENIIDSYLIAAIVLANAFLGFVQEYRAEKALEALEKLSTPTAIVLRNGRKVKIPATEVVPGDILVLNIGDKVAADCRLIEAINLKIDESLLTGESVPVLKHTDKISAAVPLADRKNCAFANTIVSYGKGLGVVYATGQNTEVGKISTLVASAGQKESPLQLKLKAVAKTLGLATIIIALIVFGLGLWQKQPMYKMALLSIALAVAAVPEGLPAIITTTLAFGVAKMARAKAIIRYLPAAETLGSCTVIATDKTGTLTKNEMTARQIYISKTFIDVSGVGYAPEGQFLLAGKPIALEQSLAGQLLLRTCALCNDASLFKNEDWQIAGDPTEGALLTLAGKANLWKEKLLEQYPQVAELSFDSSRKRMSTIHKTKQEFIVFTKGAPDILIDCCKWVLIGEKIRPLTTQIKKEILAANLAMAKKSLRVLGFAYKPLKSLPTKIEPKTIEKELVWIGLVGLVDPLRPDAIEAVHQVQKAGIKVVMITGDHVETAKAIARELSLLRGEQSVIEGAELDRMSDKELEELVEQITIYARVSPEHKIRIVRALQAKGHIVAMTGDGVNDAPALKAADIGIAMGQRGTDVAKEASAMILQDDNFATIAAAVKEGRTIYANIKKFLRYLLSSNFAEVAIIFAASLLFLPLPLLAIHILWINLLTDGLPALALGIDPPEPDIMQQKPRKEQPIDKAMLKTILLVSTIITIGTLLIFYYSLPKGLKFAQTVAFSTLVFFEMFNVYNTRSEKKSAFSLHSNKWLNLAVLSSVVLQLLVTYLPFANTLFTTAPLDLKTLALTIAVSSTVLIFGELRKFAFKSTKT